MRQHSKFFNGMAGADLSVSAGGKRDPEDHVDFIVHSGSTHIAGVLLPMAKVKELIEELTSIVADAEGGTDE